ncbi:MAG TPA: lipoprotein-releasing ABC transporter permease subunit [Gammaproteobacteria bacterium]|nr:lipoprotein-releasing ABC transporter permease subunit [Gammaproteobacteria bacterium]
MFRPLPLFIGLRYTRARRRNHYISFHSLMSMLGIALGVAALITVISVMNGFEKELRQRILGVVSHATVTGLGTALRDWQAVLSLAEHRPEVVAGAPYIRGEGMLSHGERVAGTVLRGVLPEREAAVSDLDGQMLAGRLADLRPGGFGIILGKDLAFSLGVSPGDRVTLLIPQASVTPVGVLPRMKRFTVVGVFEVGMYEYDSAFAMIHLADAARLFRMGDAVSGVRLRLRDLFQAPALARELSRELPLGHQVRDWTRTHVNFFRAVRMEKTVMFIILMLIVAVAAFNLVSTLVMMVTDKHSDIAILRTLGTSPAGVMAIFIVQGGMIGLVGVLLGLAGGVTLAQNIHTVVPAIEQLFGIKFLAPDVYYISELPSDMRWRDVWNITAIALLLCLSATLYPAWRAARTQPAEALRYE